MTSIIYIHYRLCQYVVHTHTHTHTHIIHDRMHLYIYTSERDGIHVYNTNLVCLHECIL